MHIPKIIKILVPIVIIISVVLNPLSGGFNITTSASATGVAFAFGLGQIVFNALTYLSGNADKMADGFKNFIDQTYVNMGTLISNNQEIDPAYPIVTEQYYSELDDSWHITGVSVNPVIANTCSQEEISLLNAICSYINEGGEFEFDKGAVGTYCIDYGTYCDLKEKILNAIIAEAYPKFQASLGNAVSATDVPQFKYNMFGAPSSIIMPMLTNVSPYTKDGYFFSRRIPSSVFDSDGFYTSIESALAYCDSYTVFRVDSDGNPVQVYGYVNTPPCNGCGIYIQYNGELFYRAIRTYVPSLSNDVYTFIMGLPSDLSLLATQYVNSKGETLGSKGYVVGDSFYAGCFANVGGNTSAFPVYDASLNDSDFESTTGGETIEVPRSDDEQTIANAVGLGLINENSPVTFDEQGNVATVDGITLAKLEEIANMIKDGNLNFEDVQQYLNIITQLLGTANINTSTQTTILDNIKELTETQTAAITDIKEALTDYENIKEFDTDLYSVIAKASGIAEAEAMVATAFPVVGQADKLLSNLFNWENVGNSPPNFQFYWDSDKDGVFETYTFFDLSFMELPLTNENLVDKNRFATRMTIREFVQSLIVFILYSFFAISLLRRLPGIFGAAESSEAHSALPGLNKGGD